MENQLQLFESHTLASREVLFSLSNNVWMNVTQVAKDAGKDLSNYWKSKDTSEYMEKLSKVANVESTESLKNVINNGDKTSGTYIHPELIVHFARWIDAEFAIACDQFIKQEILKEATLREKFLKEEHQKEIEQVKEDAEKVRLYDDGSTTISGLQQHYGFTEDYQLIKDALLWKDVISITPKITIKSMHNPMWSKIAWTSHGVKTTTGSIVNGYSFFEQPVRGIVDQYIAAGCPSPKLGLRRKFEDAMQDYIDNNL